MSAHTPEPWVRMIGGLDSLVMSGENGPSRRREIARCRDQWSTASGADWNFQDAGAVANADRIVVCVNACAGMADPAGDIAFMRSKLEACIAAIQQRDELADALREAQGEDVSDARSLARAILDRNVTGAQAERIAYLLQTMERNSRVAKAALAKVTT